MKIKDDIRCKCTHKRKSVFGIGIPYEICLSCGLIILVGKWAKIGKDEYIPI